jgi:hypothetical protein
LGFLIQSGHSHLIQTHGAIQHEENCAMTHPVEAASQTRYLTSKRAATYLGIGYSTLTIHRMRGDGPAFIKWGTNIRYDIGALDRWMQEHSVTPVPKPAAKRGRPPKRTAS